MNARLAPPKDLLWDDVRVFLAVHRERNLGRAAKRLALDISTASRRLAALESKLGVRLFDRRREGLAATVASEQLLPPAEEMERCLFRFANTVDALEAVVEGTVRVTAPPGLAESFLAAPLTQLLREHPRLTIELESSSTMADLTRREADIAIRARKPASGDLLVTKLRETRWVVVVAAARASTVVHDWKEERWIGWSAALGAMPASRWMRSESIVPAFVTDNLTAQLAAVASGFGLALVPESFITTQPVAPARHAKSLAESAAAWPRDNLWLVGHRAQRDVPRVAAVWQFLVTTFGGRQ
jgi:DNA-binding transcriptional LysR family regulator